MALFVHFNNVAVNIKFVSVACNCRIESFYSVGKNQGLSVRHPTVLLIFNNLTCKLKFSGCRHIQRLIIFCLNKCTIKD